MPGGRNNKTTPIPGFSSGGKPIVKTTKRNGKSTEEMMVELIEKHNYSSDDLTFTITKMIEGGLGVVDKEGAVLEIYKGALEGVKPAETPKPAEKKSTKKTAKVVLNAAPEIVNPLEHLSIEDCKKEINRLRNEQRTANKTKYWDLKNSIDAVKEVLFELKEIEKREYFETNEKERREYWDAREEIARKRHEEFIAAIDANTAQLSLYNAKELIAKLDDFDEMVGEEFGAEPDDPTITVMDEFVNVFGSEKDKEKHKENKQLKKLEKEIADDDGKEPCPTCKGRYKLLKNHTCKNAPKEEDKK